MNLSFDICHIHTLHTQSIGYIHMYTRDIELHVNTNIVFDVHMVVFLNTLDFSQLLDGTLQCRFPVEISFKGFSLLL